MILSWITIRSDFREPHFQKLPGGTYLQTPPTLLVCKHTIRHSHWEDCSLEILVLNLWHLTCGISQQDRVKTVIHMNLRLWMIVQLLAYIERTFSRWPQCPQKRGCALKHRWIINNVYNYNAQLEKSSVGQGPLKKPWATLLFSNCDLIVLCFGGKHFGSNITHLPCIGIFELVIARLRKCSSVWSTSVSSLAKRYMQLRWCILMADDNQEGILKWREWGSMTEHRQSCSLHVWSIVNKDNEVNLISLTTRLLVHPCASA